MRHACVWRFSGLKGRADDSTISCCAEILSRVLPLSLVVGGRLTNTRDDPITINVWTDASVQRNVDIFPWRPLRVLLKAHSHQSIFHSFHFSIPPTALVRSIVWPPLNLDRQPWNERKGLCLDHSAGSDLPFFNFLPLNWVLFGKVSKETATVETDDRGKRGEEKT
mmetsp:Transcript_61275/g.133115  ORF Transcript_61275/g.133115 Transcript_61275/m.133115 type:complete len:166 (-) Transcript_61275:58-555(-)